MRPKKQPLYNETNVPSVSGGKDNPPDRWVVLTIDGLNDDEAGKLLSQWGAKGYPIVGFSNGRVIMGGYKES
jgi:hypothetical protein